QARNPSTCARGWKLERNPTERKIGSYRLCSPSAKRSQGSTPAVASSAPTATSTFWGSPFAEVSIMAPIVRKGEASFQRSGAGSSTGGGGLAKPGFAGAPAAGEPVHLQID